MSVTRPVAKTETLKKTKIKPAWVLASPWKVGVIRKVVLSPGRKQRDPGVDPFKSIFPFGKKSQSI